MGLALPGAGGATRQSMASGAQVIDGSLKFNGGYLTRTPSSNGNRKTWTYSSWIKFDKNAAQSEPLLVAGNSSSDFTQIYTYKSLASDIAIASKTGSSDKVEITSNNLLRDTGWYHIVAVFDSTGSGYQTDSTIYVNGVEISRNTNTFAGGQNYESWVNSTAEPHYLGYLWNGNTFKGEMSQVYLIDGQALGPENFGYTDGLTNTWRPKKYEGTFGPVGDYVISGGSNYLNREPADMFDGSTSTYWQAAASGDRYQLMTFATPKTGTTIELSVLASNGWDGFQINGTVPSSLPSVGSQSWFNITTHTSGSLSSIRIAYTSGAETQLVYALRIDGTIITGQTQTPSASNSFYLPMDGNSPIGHDLSNPNPINDGTVWSSGVAGTQDTASGGGSVAAFDGTTGSSDSNGSYPAAGQTLTWTPANSALGTTLSYSNTIRVYVKVDTNGDDGGLTIIGANGSQTVDAGSSGTRYVDISAATSPITSIAWSRASSGGQGVGLQQVEVDGVVLVDGIYGNGWTPVNFGGSVALDNPQVSGARPILNTDGGGNVARPGVFGSELNQTIAVTVSNPGSGNKYYLDGVLSANPTLTRGVTYTFDQSNNSNSTHPLRFATAADAAGSTQYTNGVTTRGTPGSAGAYTKITVPHNAPDTLYYYCTSHGGMGSSTSQITDETKADPYAWKNVLALPLVGNTNDFSAQILPVVNDVTRLRFKTDWNWMYVSAIEINGTILTTGTLDNSGGVWSGGDNWKNGSVGSGNETYSQSARGDWFDVTLASTLNIDTLRIYVYLDSSSGVSTNVFELELFYGGGSSYLKVFPLYTDAPNGNFNQRSWQDFGSVRFNSVKTNGDPVASNAASNFYGGSFEFDGNDYLTIPNTTELTMGTGDFTVEFWYKVSSSFAGSNFYVFDFNSNGLRVQLINNTIAFATGSSLIQVTVNGADTNSWHHIACVRSSSTAILYYNGINVGTFSSTENITMGSTASIGRYGGSGNYYSGYLQDFRVYKGVAKYTSNFVVPATSPDILPDTPSGVSGGSKLAKVTDGAVSFDGSGDSLSIPDNADFDFGTGDFTVELFTYNDLAQSSNPVLIGATGGWYLQFKTGGTIVEFYTGSTSIQATGLGLEGGWHHIAVTKASNVVKIFIDGILKSTTSNSDTTNLASTLYIGNLNGASLHYLGFISNVRILKGTALYTSNFTPPTRELTNVTNTKLLCCQSTYEPGSAVVSPNISGLNNGTQWSYYTTTTKGTGGSKDFYSTGNDANHLFDGNTSLDCYGGYGGDGTNSDIVFSPPGGVAVSSKLEVYVGYYSKIKVNGSDYNTGGQSTAQAWVTVSDGSNFTGTLNTLILENTSNANVVRAAAIRINDTTVLLDPVSPEGNATATNFNPFNTDINTVRGQETGYATFNPLDMGPNGALSDGNLNFKSSTSSWSETKSTIKIPTTGKWYVEQIYIGGSSNLSPGSWGARYSFFGVCTNNYAFGNAGGSNCLVLSDNNIISKFGTQTAASGAVTKGPGGTVSLALNRDDNTYEFFYQGVSIDSGTIGTTDSELFFMVGHYPGNTTSFDFNFGQKPFKFPPPAGFQSLNAANIRPETVIARPDQYVGATLYSGNNGTTQVTTGFQPDFVWLKGRSETLQHRLVDSVRGQKQLYSNSNAAEADWQQLDILSNGFNVTNDGNEQNKSGTTYVAWTWKAGGNKNTFNVDDVGYASAAAAGLTGGSITPTGASVGTKQGFSIIKFTGSGGSGTPSIPHGLSEAPTFIIQKDTGATTSWRTFLYNISTWSIMNLNNQDGATGAAEPAPTSSLFYANGNGNATNTQIAYLWHNVPGLQKFDTFEGNGNADGPFVELGFRPSILLVRNIDNSGTGYSWSLYDNERGLINPNFNFLCPDSSNKENRREGDSSDKTDRYIDFLSNGFKMRANNANFNANAHTIFYAAWAEAPTFNLYGAQSNAR